MPYWWYQQWERPRLELLRQWCGHRAVSAQERLSAAEAECHRLDVLLTDAIGMLRGTGEDVRADRLDEEHERNRITAATVRPVIDRPVPLSEKSVRVVYKYRRAWWGT